MNEICLSCRKHTKCGRAKHETIGCGYYVPMSNEEWLRQAATEQLAELFGHIAKNAYQCGQNGKTNKCVNRNHCTGYCDYGWVEWLKQLHGGDGE